MKVRSCLGMVGVTCVALGCGASSTGENARESTSDETNTEQDASVAPGDTSEIMLSATQDSNSTASESGEAQNSSEPPDRSIDTSATSSSESETSNDDEETTGSDATDEGPTSDATGTNSVGKDSSDEDTTSDATGISSDNVFQVSVHLASDDEPQAPTTVGIVTWSTTLGTPTAATVEFGLTTDYGMAAPVDVTVPELRTLLLGMKPARSYHFRIVAMIDQSEHVSPDFTVTTGAAPDINATSITSFSVLSPAKREPGFILTSFWGSSTLAGRVIILDQDGDIVWWYSAAAGYVEGVAKLAMSADGNDLWIAPVAINGGLSLKRVGLDGAGLQEYPNVRASHDIVPIDGDVMAFLQYDPYNNVVEINRAGETKTVFTSPDSLLDSDFPHHLNAISYESTTATYAVSSLYDDVFMFPRSGASEENTVTLTSIVGPNTSWGGYQHRSELLTNNHLLMFANREGGETGPATVIEFDLDEGTEVWRYEADHSTNNFGDVQRLPSGNTLVTYSNDGVIHEVTPDHEKVLEITTADELGYATWRPSLYASAPTAE